jgi:hypothetical protein
MRIRIYGGTFGVTRTTPVFNKVCKSLMGHTVVHPAFKWLWDSPCQLKHKVFFQLLLKDRINRRGMLKRRNMQTHILVSFVYGNVRKHLGMSSSGATLPKHAGNKLEFLFHKVSLLRQPLQHLAGDCWYHFIWIFIIIMCWSIWVTRNDWIFNNEQQRNTEEFSSKKWPQWFMEQERIHKEPLQARIQKPKQYRVLKRIKID